MKQRNIDYPEYLGEQGYILEVKEFELIIAGSAPQGVFYGVQTLLQLINNDNSIKAVSVIDWPDNERRALYISRGRSPLHFEGSANEPPLFTQKQKDYIDKVAGWKVNTIILDDRRGDFGSDEYVNAYKEYNEYCKKRFIEDTPNIDSELSFDGKKSAHFISNSTKSSTIAINEYIEIEPNQKYEWSACGKGKDIKVGEQSWHRLHGTGRFYDENYERPYADHDYMLDISFDTGTFDWECVSGRKISPSDAVYFKIESLGILSSGTGEGWIDNLSFHKCIPPSYSCDGENMQGRTRYGFSKCAILAKGDTCIWYSDSVSVESKKEYILSVYIKRQNKGTEKPQLKLVWFDADNQELSVDTKSIDNVTTEYECFQMHALSPKDVSYLKIYLEGQAGGEEYFWFDTLRLKVKGTFAHIIVEGT